MAVELPTRIPRELPAPGTIALAEYAPSSIASRVGTKARPREWSHATIRAVEMLTGVLALTLIAALFTGLLWYQAALAVFLVLFDVYWLWKSWTIAYHVMKGVRLIRRFQATNWRQKYDDVAQNPLRRVIAWDAVHHVVIIPNYKENEDKLRKTLRAMALTEGARESVIPVLAMEEADVDARAKAQTLSHEFAGSFHSLLVTYHPHGLPGEVRGKSANQAWAARCAVEDLVGQQGIDIDHMTVTSCDADTIFPKQYFECLTYHFATDPNRYRRFWQAPIFFYNNIWQVPAPLRIPNALSGLVHLSRLTRKRRVLFSQSTYSLSMRMCHDVGYWDADVIPEDWHMFLKCFYRLNGDVEVEPIHLPLGNDGALSRTTRATFVNQYLQVRRWAWGAVDVPYALQSAVHHTEIPAQRRFLRFWYFFENHLTWSTQWFFITLGGFIPWVYGAVTGTPLMPDWFTWPARLILSPCLIFYFILIETDRRLRPPAPPSMTLLNRLLSYVHWLLIPPITFFFSALPALDSQIRLMLGKRMEYRVTEKV